jgi:hypothetical protein
MIKPKQLFIIVILACGPAHAATKIERSPKIAIHKFNSPANTLYLGRFSQSEQTQPIEFWVLYNGELIKTKEEEYTIKDQMLAQLHLLFIDPNKIQFTTSEENNIQGLNCLDSQYQCYQLDLTQDDNYDPELFMNTWQITPHDLDQAIPLNTLIVPIAPEQVEIKLENVTWRASNRAIKLPTIKINSKAPQLPLVKVIAEACLKCLNLRPFHAKQKITVTRHKTTQSAILIS